MTGGCLCGALRYAITGRPLSTSICHCRTCRKAAGAPSVAWAVFRRADFTLTGGHLSLHASSPHVRRGHCATCGTSLTFEEVGETTIDITLASLDDPEALPPGKEIWMSHRLSWMAVGPGRATFDHGVPNPD